MLNGRLVTAQAMGDQSLSTTLSALRASSPEVYNFVVQDQGQDPVGAPYDVRPTIFICLDLHNSELIQIVRL